MSIENGGYTKKISEFPIASGPELYGSACNYSHELDIQFWPGGNTLPPVWSFDILGDRSLVIHTPTPISWRVRFLTRLLLGSVWTKENSR